jgi:hypothetical protein
LQDRQCYHAKDIHIRQLWQWWHHSLKKELIFNEQTSFPYLLKQTTRALSPVESLETTAERIRHVYYAKHVFSNLLTESYLPLNILPCVCPSGL